MQTCTCTSSIKRAQICSVKRIDVDGRGMHHLCFIDLDLPISLSYCQSARLVFDFLSVHEDEVIWLSFAFKMYTWSVKCIHTGVCLGIYFIFISLVRIYKIIIIIIK